MTCKIVILYILTSSSCSLEARDASSAVREDRVLPIVYARISTKYLKPDYTYQYNHHG